MTLSDWLDIWMMGLSASLVFLCRYRKRRDATVGTVLFICWVYQIYETLTGTRSAAFSDVLFDAIIFVILLSAGGNIMSVVVYDGLRDRWRRVKSVFSRAHIKSLPRGKP